MDDPGPLSDRLDPGGKLADQMRGFELLTRGPGRLLLRVLGVKKADLDNGASIIAGYRQLLSDTNMSGAALPDLGWPVFELSPTSPYAHAAALVKAGDPASADRVLCHAWNDDDGILLKMAVHRVRTLYMDLDPESPDPLGPVGEARASLIQEGLDLHRKGAYAGAILITLSQMDGIAHDFGGQSFFRKAGTPTVDSETLAGHPESLAAVAKLMIAHYPDTSLSGRLGRHGIVHGRELTFANEINSTKALVTLLAVITWAQPIARARLEEARQAHIERYAGSTEVDSDGRRLDRRGFDEAKHQLFYMHGQQQRFFEEHGRYAGSLLELDPHRVIFELPLSLEQSASGDSYWSWTTTETGFVFGVAGRAGIAPAWRYAGSQPPSGGVSDDKGWRNDATEPGHPDW